MRIEKINGYSAVCGHFYPVNEIKIGSKWTAADGSDNVVFIRDIQKNIIFYGRYGNDRTLEKDSFSFQCRYCLIVEESA